MKKYTIFHTITQEIMQFLKKMFVFLQKCMNIFILMAIIDNIYPEKCDFSVEYSLFIFKNLHVTSKFSEILNDIWMFLCEHVILSECSYGFQIFVCFLFGFYVFYNNF